MEQERLIFNERTILSSLLHRRIYSTDLLLGTLLLSVLLPGHWGNNLTSFLENGSALLSLCYLLLRKRKPSNFALLCSTYFVYLISISFVNGNSMADVHLIVSYVKTTVLVLFVDRRLKDNTQNAIGVIFAVLLLLVVLDALSFVAFPTGLYFEFREYNEWSSGYVANWFLGNKNNRIYFYMGLVVLAVWRYWRQPSPFRCFSAVFLALLTVAVVCVAKSSTSIFVSVLVAAASVYACFDSKRAFAVKLNPMWIFAGYVLVLVLVLSGSTSWIGSFVSNVFGKDVTFSGRTDIWDAVWILAGQKPLFGWGVVEDSYFASLVGGVMNVNAHNQFLNTLFQGGIFLSAILAIIFLLLHAEMGKVKDAKKRTVLCVFVLAFMLDMIFEQILTSSMSWVDIILFWVIATEFSNAPISRQGSCSQGESEVRLRMKSNCWRFFES